jgi:hypothetical protein
MAVRFVGGERSPAIGGELLEIEHRRHLFRHRCRSRLQRWQLSMSDDSRKQGDRGLGNNFD